jgi:hypothetical protein
VTEPPAEAPPAEPPRYEPPRHEPPAQPPVYEIRVRGVLGRRWSPWFEGLDVSTGEPGQSVIMGPVLDQSALHGLLAKIRDLGLPLISVRVVDGTPR